MAYRRTDYFVSVKQSGESPQFGKAHLTGRLGELKRIVLLIVLFDISWLFLFSCFVLIF